jgi:hypothetical protein
MWRGGFGRPFYFYAEGKFGMTTVAIRIRLGGVGSKPRDLGSDRGYRVAPVAHGPTIGGVRRWWGGGR